MQNPSIPHGHQRIMPYIIVKNAEGFFQFIQQAFGATERYKRFQDGSDIMIMHAEATIGDSVILFADSMAPWEPVPAGLHLYVSDTDWTYQQALSLGATSVQEPNDKDYGRSAGIADPYGNIWWLTTAKEV